PCCDYCGRSHENFQCQPMDQNIDFSCSDQIQNPHYPDVLENSLTNDEFEAYTNANDANMNDLQFKLDNFQRNQQDFQEKFEQMQDDLLNQMRNFMQNFHDGLLIPPPGEEKEPEATTDMELPSIEDIQPLPVQEPPQDSDIRSDSLSLESRLSLSLKRGFEKVVKTEEQTSLAGISHSISSSKVTSHLLRIRKRFSALDFVTSSDSVSEIDIVTETDDVLPPSDENDDDLFNGPLLEKVDLFLSDNSMPPGIENIADDPEGDIRFLEELLIDDSILSHESFDF
nr:hypothetical protein [Tanacetum cinerariifolium]